jgi:hypothetical protein
MSVEEQAAEFSRRRQLAGVEVRYLTAGRTHEVSLSICGRDIGSRLEVTKRTKVVATTYFLPEMT